MSLAQDLIEIFNRNDGSVSTRDSDLMSALTDLYRRQDRKGLLEFVSAAKTWLAKQPETQGRDSEDAVYSRLDRLCRESDCQDGGMFTESDAALLAEVSQGSLCTRFYRETTGYSPSRS